MLRVRVLLAGVEKGFGRDASDIQASSAEGFAHFDAGGFHSQLRGPNRRNIASRTAADHDHIKIVFLHGPEFMKAAK